MAINGVNNSVQILDEHIGDITRRPDAFIHVFILEQLWRDEEKPFSKNWPFQWIDLKLYDSMIHL